MHSVRKPSIAPSGVGACDCSRRARLWLSSSSCRTKESSQGALARLRRNRFSSRGSLRSSTMNFDTASISICDDSTGTMMESVRPTSSSSCWPLTLAGVSMTTRCVPSGRRMRKLFVTDAFS